MNLLKRIGIWLGVVPTPPPEYDLATRASLDQFADGLHLYHFYSCPFCARVHRTLQELGIQVHLCDVSMDADHRDALINGGGRSTVPCLRISKADDQDIWLYESSDIQTWLKREVARISTNVEPR